MRRSTRRWLPLVLCAAMLPAGGGASEPAEQVHEPGGAVRPPLRLYGPEPVYPAAAVAAGVEGEVSLRAVIGADGAVRSARAVEGVGTEDESLRRAAVEAVAQWRFRPATLEGEPVRVEYNLLVNFRLARRRGAS